MNHDNKNKVSRGHWIVVGSLLFAVTIKTFAATPLHIVKTDLQPLIQAAAESPVQFATLVPHSVSTSTGGEWSTSADGVAKWSYAVQVPTAVSLSFHAVESSLPQSAILVVRGAKTTKTYSSRDLSHGELWSRIYPGEALELELTVAAKDRSKVALNIVSLQAGYRAIGSGVVDHPYYRQLQLKKQHAMAVRSEQALSSSNTSCVTNYECSVTPNNSTQGAATIGLVIGNMYQCTGTLINDVPGDNKPYVLTARHCETGRLGGGNPGVASAVTVYWDATTPCGSTLGSLYDPVTSTQSGAQTVVEQQDAWLLLLEQNPVVLDAQLAGFDASGSAVQGGYTIHHAEGNDKQFTSWFGQAASVQQSNAFGVEYLSNFLETVNAIGVIGPGASGGGFFDQNNRLVGSLTFGRKTNDASGYESCPATNPSVPDGNNGVADFTSLSAVWNSTADMTSTTGNTTFKAILDPTNTGTLTTNSMAASNIQLSASPIANNGQPIILLWSAPGATVCTPSDGVAGDGWAGSLSAAGSQSVNETSPGIVTYTLTCNYPAGRTGRTSVTVQWVGPAPFIQFTAPSNAIYGQWTTRPVELAWSSNVAPCSLNGGGVSLSNLAASGSTMVTQAVAGEVTYTLTCGPANNQGIHIARVNYVTPSLVLEVPSTDQILGQGLFKLQWISFADTCVPSGGAPGDGWDNTAFGPPFGNGSGGPTGSFFARVTTPGTYTYTLTCSSGSISLQKSVTVKFENDAPYVNASLSNSSVFYSNSPADYVTLNYISNMSSCFVNTTPHIEYSYNDPLGGYTAFEPEASQILMPSAPGSYLISVTCGLNSNNPISVTSAPLTLTVLPPSPATATISVTPSSVVAGQNFTISYSSTDAVNCLETGHIGAGIPWGDFIASSGSITANTLEVGIFSIGITCQSVDPNQGSASAQTTLTVLAQSSSSSSSNSSSSSSSASSTSSSSTSGSGGGGGASSDSHGGGGGGIQLIDLCALALLLLMRRRDSQLFAKRFKRYT